MIFYEILLYLGIMGGLFIIFSAPPFSLRQLLRKLIIVRQSHKGGKIMAKNQTTKEKYTPIREVIAELSPDAREVMYQDMMNFMRNQIFVRNIVILVMAIMTIYLVVMKFI